MTSWSLFPMSYFTSNSCLWEEARTRDGPNESELRWAGKPRWWRSWQRRFRAAPCWNPRSFGIRGGSRCREQPVRDEGVWRRPKERPTLTTHNAWAKFIYVCALKLQIFVPTQFAAFFFHLEDSSRYSISCFRGGGVIFRIVYGNLDPNPSFASYKYLADLLLEGKSDLNKLYVQCPPTNDAQQHESLEY